MRLGYHGRNPIKTAMKIFIKKPREESHNGGEKVTDIEIQDREHYSQSGNLSRILKYTAVELKQIFQKYSMHEGMVNLYFDSNEKKCHIDPIFASSKPSN